jgi:GT2 family glycosyltransferase
MESQKIGIGVVTCNRPEFFLKCMLSLPQEYEIVVVNDGSDFTDINKLKEKINFHYIHNPFNIGVGKSKNKLFKYLLKQGCEHIFIIEDDIIIKNKAVFQKYIEARYKTGIQHFNFGYHGPANRNNISKGKPTPKHIIDYDDNLAIAINTHSVGAFCYYTREVLEKVGLIDETYCNAFEHVDHDYRIAKAGYCTPYWNWPDLANSYEYIDELACSEESSAIRPRADWRENIIRGANIFKRKHNYTPAWESAVPDTRFDDLKKILKDIHKKYAKK